MKECRYLLIIVLALLLVSCNHSTKPQNKSPINVEMFGTWRNDSGCTATFAKRNEQLVLIKFDDGKHNVMNDIILLSNKVSIMTTFRAQNAEVEFNGSFSEGVIIISTYCTTPLHKIDN